jgi:hypothetical protein
MKFAEILYSESNEWEKFYWFNIFAGGTGFRKSDLKILAILRGTRKNSSIILSCFIIYFLS